MKKTKLCLLLGILLTGFLCAQSNEEDLNAAAEQLEIGGIVVEGIQEANDKAIVTISGLRVGDRIQVPGPKIQQAIKALWKLQLFRDIQILETDRKGDIIFLKILVQEMPRLAAFYLQGVKRKWQEPLRKIIAQDLIISASVSQEAKTRTKRNVQEWLSARGYYFAQVEIISSLERKSNKLKLDVQVDLGEKVKVSEINFKGNTTISDRTLRKKMQTKDKHALFSRKNFLATTLESDQKAIIQFYQTKGFLDASIEEIHIDTLGTELHINIRITEGSPYRFRNI